MQNNEMNDIEHDAKINPKNQENLLVGRTARSTMKPFHHLTPLPLKMGLKILYLNPFVFIFHDTSVLAISF